MCKGCIELHSSNAILLSQLEKAQERADRYEKLLLGVSDSIHTDEITTKGIPGVSTWSQQRRRFEKEDLRKLKELQQLEDS